MIWDKLFWLWFLVSSVIFLPFLVDEPSLSGIFFGSVLAGLGLAKMAGEGSRSRPSVSSKPLDKLRR